MGYKVILRNVKNIKELSFDVPTNSGVYVLTGLNGSGKTSLLVALDRINNPKAFSEGYRISDFEKYENASISYCCDNGDSVTYHRAGVRWPPSPKIKASVLKSFPFSESLFLTTTGVRLYVTQSDLSNLKDKTNEAEPHIKEAMNKIFDTDKYDFL